MSKERNAKKGTYYFVTLETRGRKDWFAEDGFRTRVERLWVEVMRAQEGIDAEEYAVNDHALHALMLVAAADGRERLDQPIADFMGLASADWKPGGASPREADELWNPVPKFRRIENETELRSLREFIVQKMLGGQEINDLEDFEDEEY